MELFIMVAGSVVVVTIAGLVWGLCQAAASSSDDPGPWKPMSPKRWTDLEKKQTDADKRLEADRAQALVDLDLPGPDACSFTPVDPSLLLLSASESHHGWTIQCDDMRREVRAIPAGLGSANDSVMAERIKTCLEALVEAAVDEEGRCPPLSWDMPKPKVGGFHKDRNWAQQTIKWLNDLPARPEVPHPHKAIKRAFDENYKDLKERFRSFYVLTDCGNITAISEEDKDKGRALLVDLKTSVTIAWHSEVEASPLLQEYVGKRVKFLQGWIKGLELFFEYYGRNAAAIEVKQIADSVDDGTISDLEGVAVMAELILETRQFEVETELIGVELKALVYPNGDDKPFVAPQPCDAPALLHMYARVLEIAPKALAQDEELWLSLDVRTKTLGRLLFLEEKLREAMHQTCAWSEGGVERFAHGILKKHPEPSLADVEKCLDEHLAHCGAEDTQLEITHIGPDVEETCWGIEARLLNTSANPNRKVTKFDN